MAAAEAVAARDRILRERARLLARAGDQAAAAASLQLLVFELGQETYATEMRYVREVHALKDLVRVPCAPRFILGIISVRGEICPVIDLKRLFGMPEHGLTNATRAVIVREGSLEYGIVADAVLGVRAMPAEAIEPPPATLAGINAEFLRGLTRDGLIVLDAPRMLAHPSMIVREEVGDLG